MLHIATVHWQTDRWIDVQLKYLAQNLSQPYRVYAFLSENLASHSSKYFYACKENVASHAVKLNILADLITFSAQDLNDTLIFLDGDAFPIKPIDSFLSECLLYHPLAAIRRDENIVDQQPHPSFCVTTVGFWKSIKGDWKEGATWETPSGAITDVGGNLLQQLKSGGVSWLPILRSHSTPSHPLWFGVYGGIIYHHGSGFRIPISRVDRELAMTRLQNGNFFQQLLYLIFTPFPQRIRYLLLRYSGSFRKIIRSSYTTGNQIYGDIVAGIPFWEKLSNYKG